MSYQNELEHWAREVVNSLLQSKKGVLDSQWRRKKKKEEEGRRIITEIKIPPPKNKQKKKKSKQSKKSPNNFFFIFLKSVLHFIVPKEYFQEHG